MAFFEVNGAEVPIAEGSIEEPEELVGGVVTTITGQRRRRVRARLRSFRIVTAELTFDDMSDLLDVLRGPGTLNITGDWINAVCFAEIGAEGPVRGDAGFYTLEFTLREVGGVVGAQLPEDPEAQIELEQDLAALNTDVSGLQSSIGGLQSSVGTLESYIPGQVIDGTQFGLVANTNTTLAASANVTALNAIFAEFRSRIVGDGRITIYIPPGRYYINAPIWAGFGSGSSSDFRDWVLEAWGVRLVAQDGLANRVMFDMTGCRRATLLGLQLTTVSTPGNEPAVGILMARDTFSGHSGLNYVERIRIEGSFQVATLLKQTTEIDYFLGCTFRNDYSDGGAEDTFGVVIVQGTNALFNVPSEFATVQATNTNVDHWFRGCSFANFTASNGTLLWMINVDRMHVEDCYFESTSAADDFIGARILEDTVTTWHTYTFKNCHFHESGWDACILVEDNTSQLSIIDCGHSVKAGSALLRIAAGVSVTGLYLQEDAAAAAAGMSIDASAAGANVFRADITCSTPLNVAGDIHGIIRTTAANTLTLPAGANVQVTRWGDRIDHIGLDVTFDGDVTMSNLPMSNPSVAGRLWNDGGTLKVSAG